MILIWAIGAGQAALTLPAPGADPAPPPAAPATAILANDSYLRGFFVFRTPVCTTKEGDIQAALEPMGKEPKPLPEFQSLLPPPGWTDPEFDDSAWDRLRAPVEMSPGGATGRSHAARHTATANSLICLRAKFIVDDARQAEGLKLSLDYVGGVVVFVNGQEVTRGGLAAGAIKPETLAEKYPEDLYCEPGDAYLQSIKKNPAGFERRYRRLQDAPIPARLLRKGTNVLALEFHRAPINAAAIAARRVDVGGMYEVPGMWAYVGLRNLSLTAPTGSPVAANMARPKGIQVWNLRPSDTISCFDYGDPGDPLRPVTIAAVKNSVFSGRLAVSSDETLRDLKVTLTDLKLTGGGSSLPASAVKVRFAESATPEKCWTPPSRFNALLDAIPAEIPVARAPLPKERYLVSAADSVEITRQNLAAGAVAPIWLTLRVPKDAKAGRYEGQVTVEAAGSKATMVPLLVTVHGWTLPDPRDFRTHHLIFVSQEAVARHYGVPFWSDKHFELMGRSLALLAEVNSREIPLNLCVDFYGRDGNEQSLVRWMPQPDGSFKHDFTVFDKYLDLVARHCGQPCPLRLNCWGEAKAYNEYKEKKSALIPCGTFVTRLDPASGKLDSIEQPCPGTLASLEFWRPVLREAVAKVAARGWLDSVALGHNSYCYEPAPGVISVGKQIWPEGVWAYTAHNGTLGRSWRGLEEKLTMPVKYSVCVWTEGRLNPRGARELLKPRPGLWCDTARTRHRDGSPLAVIRNLPEEMVLRGHDGVGDFGGDLFPVKNPKGNGYFCLGNGRGTGGPNDAQRAILAPGPSGPVATERFESFREGVEVAEAILFLESALQEKKISGPLAVKVNQCLDERGETFCRYWYERGWDFINRMSPAGHLERDARLFSLCAEVATESNARAEHRRDATDAERR
jgi:hypothetical protein